MEKIISLFQRNYDGDHLVRDEVVPGAEWVLAGWGRATRKWDGTCCLVQGGKLFKRYTVKKGKVPPIDFIPATDVDPNTGKRQGWRPVGPGDKWHLEVMLDGVPDGTYELIGPKINGNPDGVERHCLRRHGAHGLSDVPRTFDSLKEYLRDSLIEGIVWHHVDGRMVKIKRKDFYRK